MKRTRSEIEADLVERRKRLKDVEIQGANALSRYDREIAYSGDLELAVRATKQLLSNQIKYLEGQLAQAPPEQAKLF